MDDLKELLDNIDLYLADFESLGAALIAFGYFKFVESASQDKQLIFNERNNIESPNLFPAKVILSGEEDVLSGLAILTAVAFNRLEEKKIDPETTDITPYEEIANSYILSVIANYIRVKALRKIADIDSSSETLV